ncbi:uncharacterized protein LOC131935369 [Physella acuta]|uniref:uncharacterized protein LOC131935369 n=1 Tax=Physella acuta TaxID=109671 RepID=UPI0027DB70EF|nr:uncharacterized protein LOC131935369 [Physella acuta]
MASFSNGFKNSKPEHEIRESGETWQQSRDKCEKSADHVKLKLYRSITQQTVEEHFKKHIRLSDEDFRSFCENDAGPIFDLITNMGKLTVYMECILTDGTKKISCGTAFIQRIKLKEKESCQCKKCMRLDESKRKKVWAVLTLSSVYHVMDNVQKNMASTKVILYYENETDVLKTLPKLTLHRIQDTEKDGGENDWCGFECVIHDKDLIDDLKGFLDKYEQAQKKVYQLFQKDYLKDKKVLVIIGHPHGGPKMVSVDEWDEKEMLKDVRDRQEWCRYSYVAATCPGSSGSPVYILGQKISGFGYWFGHTHNHSSGYSDRQTVKRNYSSIGTNQLA